VLRVGGYLVVFVPHQFLYERRVHLPSRWNGDHRRFYTPKTLLEEIEEALPVNGYRIRHLQDNDEGFAYDTRADEPPRGAYEIELVVERIARPAYMDAILTPEYETELMTKLDQVIEVAIREQLRGSSVAPGFAKLINSMGYFTPWHTICAKFLHNASGRPTTVEELKTAVRPLLDYVEVDDMAYLGAYPTLREAYLQGQLRDPAEHWRSMGYFESRLLLSRPASGSSS
jgi:hypothetical protein